MPLRDGPRSARYAAQPTMRLRSPRPHAFGLALALAFSPCALAQIDAPFEQRLQHWAWKPLVDTAPPRVAETAFVRDPIDAFVLEGLETSGIPHADPAPAGAWLRRVCFDLTGLPPDESQVAAFLADPSQAARERVVDRLLASQHYGERWARHWLDLVRYAETLGHEFDFEIPNAWRYRDYVIRALNSDVPFDRFAKEHVAGDLLPAPRVDPATGIDESGLGTAFFWFCEQTHSPIDTMQHQADRIDNQIDVLTKTFLGVTVACARCHDHKFDAIGDEDYYALYGFLKSSRYAQRPLRRPAPAALANAITARESLAALATGPEEAAPAEIDASLRGFTVVGDALVPRRLRHGVVESVDDEGVSVRELQGAWLCSADASTSRDCVLMSPTWTIDTDFVHVEVAGKDARAQLIVDGFYIVRDPLYGGFRRDIGKPQPHWIRFDVKAFRGRTAHLQLLDQRAHDLADPARDRSAYPDEAWVAVRRLAKDDSESPPGEPAIDSVQRLRRSEPEVARRLDAWRAATAALPKPATAPGTADGTGEDERVFERGSHKTLGNVARRRFLRAIAGDAPMEIAQGSGRLELAERMFANDNPLPSRVLANRIWRHMFGRGLAATVDNLGHLGEAPTHPELLDHLAISLVRGGWSQKALLRRIALSSTYAMDSVARGEAATIDPDNRRLSRQNLRRLEGEAVRDAILVASERLDDRQSGPSVPVRLHADEKGRGKPAQQGPVDGNGRRSVYLATPRNFLPDLLVAFDLPRPVSSIGMRTSANVPAQSLALQNDPFVHAMARLCAEHILQDGDATDEARIGRWFLRMFARSPERDETALCAAFLADTRGGRDDDDEAAAWAALAHALWNKKEFVYLR
jgi:Protein of unknown function (DUF1549)/Protein of unknown function (DUF1553)